MEPGEQKEERQADSSESVRRRLAYDPSAGQTLSPPARLPGATDSVRTWPPRSRLSKDALHQNTHRAASSSVVCGGTPHSAGFVINGWTNPGAKLAAPWSHVNPTQRVADEPPLRMRVANNQPGPKRILRAPETWDLGRSPHSQHCHRVIAQHEVGHGDWHVPTRSASVGAFAPVDASPSPRTVDGLERTR